MTTTPFLNTRYERKDGRYAIYVRIADSNKQKLIPVGYKIEKKYWENEKVKKNHPEASIINAKIADIIRSITVSVATAELAGRKAHFGLLGTGKRSFSFIDFLRNLSLDYEKTGKVIMAIKIGQVTKELTEVFGALNFDQINSEFIKQLDHYYEKIGNAASTKAKKMKVLAMSLEIARKENMYSDRNFFKDYKVKAKTGFKVKLTQDEIAILEKIELTGLMDLSRDMFLFSYYTKGMRFGDCLWAKKSDIVDGRLQIIDQKTGKISSHRIHERLEHIISKYPTEYIFPLLSKYNKKIDKYEHIRIKGSMNALVNKYLKKVAQKAGIDKPISMHIARHSFANQLKEIGISPWVIMESLNHSSIQTTQNYLKELNKAYLDDELLKLYGK